MQGPPPEGYQPLPPNPPENNYHGEVENHSDTGSVVTPPLDNLEGTLVTVENPNPCTTSVLVTPLEPLLLRLDSLGNVIDEEIPQLPKRDFTETYMGSTKPTFDDEYRTPIHPTTAVDTNPTPSHSVWITPSIRSLTLLLHQHNSILMLDSSPLLIPQALRSLPLLSQTFTLQLHMFRTILLGHLCTKECRCLLAKYNRLEGNHHLVDLSLLEDHHSMASLPLPGDNPLSMFLLEGNLPFPVIPRLLIHH
jgi:hypothetical protein